MNPNELLPLRDIHLPPAIGWWPPPMGWWLVPLLLALGALATAWSYKRRRRRGAVRRIALQELNGLQQAAGLSASAKLQRLSVLLRRTALSLYPRTEVSALQGRAWLEWLDRALGDGRFLDGPGRLLDDAPYRPDCDGADLEPLFALCRDWLAKLPAGR